MKKISNVLFAGLVAILGLGVLMSTGVHAEEETSTPPATSIRLQPVSKILQISSNSSYDDKFEIFNDGSSEIRVEVYAAPYSYVYSEEEGTSKLGFNNENNFTQITRWITFQNNDSYTEKAIYTIPANESREVNFRINTPKSIPAGGQYAVIFAHTLSDSTPTSGIRTEASPGIVVYGRSTEGETKSSAEITNLNIEQSVTDGTTTRNNFSANAKIKNTGNIDFTANGRLKVEPIIGGGSYGTDENQPTSRISVIPESELILTDEWTETPNFGIYKVTWTVTAAGTTEEISKTIFLIPVWFILIVIILLTILTIWIIITIRKHKERRSRLAI